MIARRRAMLIGLAAATLHACVVENNCALASANSSATENTHQSLPSSSRYNDLFGGSPATSTPEAMSSAVSKVYSYYYNPSIRHDRLPLKHRSSKPNIDKKALDSCEERYGNGRLGDYCHKQRRHRSKSSEEPSTSSKGSSSSSKSSSKNIKKGMKKAMKMNKRGPKPSQNKRPSTFVDHSTKSPAATSSEGDLTPPTIAPSTKIQTLAPDGEQTQAPSTQETQAPKSDMNITLAPQPATVVAVPTMLPIVATLPVTESPNRSISPSTTLTITKMPTKAPTLALTDSPMILSPTSLPRTLEPTTAPSSIAPNSNSSSVTPTILPTIIQTTLLPTQEPTLSFLRRATPFSVSYIIDNSVYTDEQFEAAQALTLQYLEDYFFEQFASSDETIIETFMGQVVGVESGSPPEAVYSAELVFKTTSAFVPTIDEVDVLLELSFNDPFVTVLLEKLRQLPLENPFSGTQTVLYTTRDDLDDRSKEYDDAFVQSTSTDDIPDSTAKKSKALGITGMETIVKSMTLQITPFSITYDIAGGYPSAKGTKDAARVTLSFLDEYLQSTFDSAEPGTYEYLAGAGLGSYNYSKISYLIGVQMADRAIVTREEIDQLLQKAFLPPFVEALIYELQSLPSKNPFSTTISLTYKAVITPAAQRNSARISPILITGIAVGAFMTLTILGAFATMKYRKRGFISDRTAGESNDDLIEIISEEKSSVQSSSLYVNGCSDAVENNEDTVVNFGSARKLLQEGNMREDPLFRPVAAYDVVSGWHR